MEIEYQTFEYSAEDGTVFEGFLALPRKRNGPLPGVLVYHAFRGVGEFEKERAKELAKLGFAALAADVYGKGKRGGSFEECFAVMRPFMEDRPVLLKKSLLSSYHALQSVEGVDGTKIGAMGYCFGGLCALDLARHKVGLKAAVSFHGTLKPLDGAALEHFDTAIQVHHGDADDHINPFVPAFQQEMRDRDADWQFTSYGKAMHGFTEPEADKMGKPGLAYNKEADTRSWSAATALFKEKLM